MEGIFELREYKDLHSELNAYDNATRFKFFDIAKLAFFEVARNDQDIQKLILIEYQVDKDVIWYTFERNNLK